MLIAHITDTHVVPKGSHWLNEPRTQIEKRLVRVVEYLNQLNPQPDVVLLSGDLCDVEEIASYEYLRELLAPLKSPLYVIPGNHDIRALMRIAFSDQAYMPQQGFIHYFVEHFPLDLIAVDTLEEGKPAGAICEERFSWLQQQMARNPGKPKLIFLHHPPMVVGHKMFDAIRCFVPDGFESWVAKQENLLGILAGHQHQMCYATYGGKPCMVAQSVAPAHYFGDFHGESGKAKALQLDDPAVMLHYWSGGKHLVTRTIQLPEQSNIISWAGRK